MSSRHCKSDVFKTSYIGHRPDDVIWTSSTSCVHWNWNYDFLGLFNVFLEIPYAESWSHMETSLLICNANRLMCFCGVPIFSMGGFFQQTVNNHEGRMCKQIEKEFSFFRRFFLMIIYSLFSH